MKTPDPLELYDLLYGLAARDGREAALFGGSAPFARSMVKKALIGDGCPTFYLELPLIGAPRFDVLVGYGRVSPDARFSPGAGFGYQPLFRWFSALPQGQGVSCGFALDCGTGQAEQVGVYLQFRGNSTLTAPFLNVLGESKRLSGLETVLRQLPEGMRASYLGLFPARKGAPARIGGYLCGAAVREQGLMKSCFDRIGFSAYDASMLDFCNQCLSLVTGADFQFDLFPDGSLGDVFGLSLSCNDVKPRQAAEWMDTGSGKTLMTLLEQRGLADERWKRLSGAALSKGIRTEGENGENKILGLAVRFNYVKIKFQSGLPVAAKFYMRLHAGVLSSYGAIRSTDSVM